MSLCSCNFYDVEFLRDAVEKLWQIIDDIDSYGDLAKSNDAFYRNCVERRHATRWIELNIVSDGYDIYRAPQIYVRDASYFSWR